MLFLAMDAASSLVLKPSIRSYPSLANCCEIPKPMPRVPPVTIALLDNIILVFCDRFNWIIITFDKDDGQKWVETPKKRSRQNQKN
jgi:hypothetical protein